MHSDAEKGVNVLKRAFDFLFYTNAHKALLISLDNVSNRNTLGFIHIY